jgi:hypothetical protein
MRTADLITVAVLMSLGGVVVSDALRLGIGWGTDGPKSGFLPFWLATITIAASLAILVQTLRRPDGKVFIRREALGPVLKVLSPAVLMVILVHFVGLYVSAALYMGLYMRWIGRHQWGVVVVLSIAIPTIAFWVFENWFLVPMPKGPLEAWLGY